MKIGEYKQMMSFLLNPKHIHHGTKVVQGVPYVPKGYEKGGRVYRAEGDPNPDSDFNFEPGLEINQSPVSDFNPSIISSKINPNTAIAASNKEKAQNAFYDLQKQLKRTPLMNEIADESGLSVKTVRTHLKDINFERMPGNIVMGFYQEIGDPNVTKPMYTNQGNKWPDQQTKDEYEYQIKERKKYAKNDPELQSRFESNDLLTNEQLSEKYGINSSKVDKINKQIVKDYNLDRPVSGRSEIQKRADEKRVAFEQENSSPIVEKQLQGTKDVHLGHMSDLSNLPVNTETLGYVPQRLNSVLAGKADAAIRAVIEQQNKIIENKPQDWETNKNFQKELERLNNLGQDYAARAGGYKVFEPIDLKNLERYTVGVDYGKTIDPTGIYEKEGKPSLIKDIEPEFRKKEINKIQNVFNNVQKEKIQAATEGRKPDFSNIKNIDLYTEENRAQLIKNEFFQKNSNAVRKNLSKIPKSQINNIIKELSVIKKPYFKKGGRVHLKDGTQKYDIKDFIPNFNRDPIEDLLVNSIITSDDPKEVNKLYDQYKHYKSTYSGYGDYLKKTASQLATPEGAGYLLSKGLKGGVEGTEYVVGQALRTLGGVGEYDPSKNVYENLLYEPVAGEKLGLDKLIEKFRPKNELTGTKALGNLTEQAAGLLNIGDIALLNKLRKPGIESLKGAEEIKDLLDPSKRDTLKIGAGMGVGAALSPIAKMLGDLEKITPKKAPLLKVMRPLGETKTQFPEWFPSLINRIRKEGEMTPIYRTEKIPITNEEFMQKIKKGEGKDVYLNPRTEEYFRQNPNEYPYYKIKKTDDIIGYEYTDKNLPDVKVTEYGGEEANVHFKNHYSQPVEINYKRPSFNNKGEFAVKDSVPEPGTGFEDVPDFEQSHVSHLDEVLGGTGNLEKYATRSNKYRATKGEAIVDEANARAEAEADRIKDEESYGE